MTDRQLAFQTVSETRRRIPAIALAACVMASLAITGIAAAQAKQQCSAAAGHDGYWSWRMVDGRKCWYVGKPMLSKALLEWPAEAAAQPDSAAEPPPVRAESHGDPMDAQASMAIDSPTFEALWRSRIER